MPAIKAINCLPFLIQDISTSLNSNSGIVDYSIPTNQQWSFNRHVIVKFQVSRSTNPNQMFDIAIIYDDESEGLYSEKDTVDIEVCKLVCINLFDNPYS